MRRVTDLPWHVVSFLYSESTASDSHAGGNVTETHVDTSHDGANRVFVSVGSNLGDRLANLRRALDGLEQAIDVDSVSAVYETEPVGPANQPSFLNAAVGGTTGLEPHGLLVSLKRLEQLLGRTPTYRWGPRIIDIDILFYGQLVLQDEDLIVPHPELQNRAFVLVPLAEIAPNLHHPRLGLSVAVLRDEVSGQESVRPFPGALE